MSQFVNLHFRPHFHPIERNRFLNKKHLSIKLKSFKKIGNLYFSFLPPPSPPPPAPWAPWSPSLLFSMQYAVVIYVLFYSLHDLFWKTNTNIRRFQIQYQHWILFLLWLNNGVEKQCKTLELRKNSNSMGSKVKVYRQKT